MGLLRTYESDGAALSGELLVRAECLAFTQIPRTTRLFSDFVADSPTLRPFYPRTANFHSWLHEEASQVRYDRGRRQQVAGLLQRQNTAWGASAKTRENIQRLRAGAAAVVTGQQVGLFGGPLFSLFKALSAVKLAQEATQAGIPCVPIFWLATQDHDLAEVNHTSFPGENFLPARLTTPSQAIGDAPVGTVQFGPEIEAVVAQAAALLGENEVTTFLRDSYRPGETLGSAFARLFARLFADWGVVLLDACDAELGAIAGSIYRGAIERASELDDALLARGKALEAAGYHQQVKVTSSTTLMFALRDGARTPVRRRSNGNAGEFVIGKDVVSRADLLRQLAAAPHDFSANALLRPVVQDYLLPTLAYVGGAAEVAYFAQAAVVYEALLERVTPILPRFSATLVEAKPKALLERYDATLPDLFHGPERLREALARRTLPSHLQSAFDQAGATLDQSLGRVREALAQLDVTLVDAAGNAGSKMKYQLERLRDRAARAESLRTGILARHAEALSNALYPNKTLQEREIAGVYFVARYGRDLLHRLYEVMHTDCLDHQVVEV